MICAQCGSENRADRRFCLECGAALAVACPACGSANEPGAKFCGTCGIRLATGEAVVDRPAGHGASAPGGGAERRVVSILFADLVGFTTLAADRDPEAVRELLGRYFDVAREVVRRYGGTVEKFIGDAVMAVWGAPTAHEDDAERAVRAALDIVDEIPALGAGADLDLRVRAAVLTGEVAVTVGAIGQGLVAGDLVNAASRLQAAAAPGTVLVGEATRLAAGAAIAFEAAGEHALRGRPAPLPAWRALRVVAERGGTGRTDALEPPFVGRGDELRFLKEQFHAAGRERRARLVSLVGQAGIGKSRLAWEMEKYLDGVVELVRWHRGRCPAYGEGVTFWALGEMIRRRAGLAEGDDETKTRRAVAAMLVEHVPDADERRWIEPRLLALLGVEETPSGGREELFAAWRTFFERLAASGTVALVFEDIQWADDGLLDFVEHLLDWSRNQPIFVVTLARPELLERRPGWGTDRRGAAALRLDPLPESAMRELLTGLVPGLPEPVVARILARADGIPLYAVETIRMLVADGRLEAATDGTHRPVGDLGDLEVPPTLHALVAARLDALPPADRALIQVASVLGQSFTESALAAVAEEDPSALTARLAPLRRRDLLVVETDPRAPTRGQHAFVQALVREVAYGTLSKKDRRARHLAAARYFESLGDEELAGVLATHHLAAWRAAPEGAEGEAAAAQARISLRAAADRADALGARGQAADWLQAALEVTTDPVERAALIQRRGWTQTLAGRLDEAETSQADAVGAWHAVGDRASALLATAQLIATLLSGGKIAQAQATVDANRAEAEALHGHDTAALALAWFWEVSGRAAFRANRNAEAVELCDRSLGLAEPLRLDEVIAMALITKSSAMIGLGHYRQGIALLNGAYLDAAAHGRHAAGLRAGVNLAAMTADVDPRASLAWTREGMATARRLGLNAFSPYHASNISPARRTGDWDWIHDAATELLDLVREAHNRSWIEDAILWIDGWRGRDVGNRPTETIRLAEEAGDPQQIANGLDWAMEWAFLSEDLAAAVGYGRRLLARDASTTLATRAMAGRVALHAGDVATAERAARSLEPTRGGAMDVDHAALQAGIAAATGRTEEALAGYRAVLAGYRDLGLPFDVAMTGLDMAALIGPREPAVVAAAAEARATFAELGAAPLLARLDRLMETQSAERAPGSLVASAVSDR